MQMKGCKLCIFSRLLTWKTGEMPSDAGKPAVWGEIWEKYAPHLLSGMFGRCFWKEFTSLLTYNEVVMSEKSRWRHNMGPNVGLIFVVDQILVLVTLTQEVRCVCV